ncbi:MAG TPA: glycosyltransferase family 4 protein [Pyrinomonadaceae bacterium]|nr:glycosyltransferase family 4 protein [Pyrinomonadaceae bacterium]
MPNRLPKIAWLSPLPPQRSGIAHYSYWLVKALKPYFEIDLYHDGGELAADLRREFDVYPHSAFAGRYGRYDEAVYHLGNHSDFHRGIYELAWNFPGTVELHDYNLAAFMYQTFHHRDDGRLYAQALIDGYGDEAREAFQALAEGRVPDPMRFPMSRAVAARSRKVVVHHRWVKTQLGGGRHVEIIPLFTRLERRPTREEVESFKKRFGLRDTHFVVSCLGFVNVNKLPWLQAEVVGRLIRDGYPVQLVFAGESAPEVESLKSEVRAAGLGRDIIFTGYLDEKDYFSAVFASDVIVNLRNPSMGEASATLMHALAAARPTIVSDLNQYREFPDKVCWKLAHGENQADELYAYLAALLSDKYLRAAISSNAAEYVRTVLGWEKIIARWRQVISK